MKRLLILILGIVPLLCSCEKSPSELLLGTWQVQEYTIDNAKEPFSPLVYRFDADGAYNLKEYSGDMFRETEWKYVYDTVSCKLEMSEDPHIKPIATFPTQNKMVWKWTEENSQFRYVLMRTN